jgi:hypothetical protein
MTRRWNCEACGAEFRAARSTARFCSDTCRQQAHREALSVTKIAGTGNDTGPEFCHAKNGGNAGLSGPAKASFSPPRNPDPERLVWHDQAKAFRLTEPPTKRCVDCCKRTSFGDTITCGLCDGRAKPPARFTGPWPGRCGYCGAEAFVMPGAALACEDCRTLKERIVASGETRDDRIALEIHRILAARDRRAIETAETEEIKKQRARNRRQMERRHGWAAEAAE